MQNLRVLLLYTDPGMGAMVWQLAAASFIGAAFYFRQYFAKLKTTLAALRKKKSQSNIA